MSNEKKLGFKWLEKLKKIKHIEIYIAIIFISILLLIYLPTLSNTDKPKKSTTNELTVTAYISNLEKNLQDILSDIGGVSNVKVLITLDMAQAEIVNSNITLDKFPPIKGIIVTAKGVNNTTNRLKVLHAIEAVIDVTNGNIEILSNE